MSFTGKTIVITGAASGIGLACARAFGENGAKGVLIADVNEKEGLFQAEKLKKDTGCDVRFIKTDISNESDVAAMAALAVGAWGKVDILVNNASICPLTAWDGLTKENWERVIAINLTGTFLCTKAVAATMRKEHSGAILFISSTAAIDGSHIAHPAYGVTKAGILAFMKSVAKEFSGDGIRVNAIMPGPVETDLSAHFSEKQRENFAQHTLLKRYGKPSEVANAVLFLCGGDASFITGATLQVSGGEILY